MANSLPRVASSALYLLSFSARAALFQFSFYFRLTRNRNFIWHLPNSPSLSKLDENASFALHLLHLIPIPKPDEKCKLCLAPPRPILSQNPAEKRNPFPAPSSPPIQALPPAEKRKPCQPASTAARRWAACSRSLFRPKFLHSAIPLPRVVPPLFPLFRFSLARCRSFFSLMRNVQPLPLSRGYRGGQRPRRTLKGGQGV